MSKVAAPPYSWDAAPGPSTSGLPGWLGQPVEGHRYLKVFCEAKQSHSLELPPSFQHITFCGPQSSTSISYKSHFSFLLLWEHCSQPSVASINLEDERQREVCVGKHWGSSELGPQCLKTFLTLLGPVLNDILGGTLLGPGPSQLSYQSVKGGCQLCKTLHKVAVIACKSQEGPELRDSFGRWAFCHSLYLGWICEDTISRDYVAQITHLRLEKGTFGEICPQSLLLKPTQYCFRSLKMLLYSGREHDNVIQVKEQWLTLLMTKDSLH